jgi:hypothetical protein
MNTLFLLMAQYGARATIPADTVCRDFFPDMPFPRFLRKTMVGEIPLPVMRLDRSQKTARAVHMHDLARYIDGGLSTASLATAPRPKRAAIATPDRAADPVVYFIRSRDMVKIGFTGNITKRLSSMRTASADELTLLYTMPGGTQMERRLHKTFAHLRVSGEWFRLEGPLAEFLEGKKT